VTERKATLLIDVARAFLQWGRHEKAYIALRAAAATAHEEVSGRPLVHRLLRELRTTAPPTDYHSTGRSLPRCRRTAAASLPSAASSRNSGCATSYVSVVRRDTLKKSARFGLVAPSWQSLRACSAYSGL
jgi:hypothetical protein